NRNTPGAPDIAPFRYGAPGWLPVVGDWDGNGTATVGVVDPTTMTWYLRNRTSPGAADFAPFAYGAAGWQPVPGSTTPLLRLYAAHGAPAGAPLGWLSDAELQQAVAGALSRLAQAGVDPAVLALLQAAQFRVSPLSAGTLSLPHVHNRTVLVSPDAAGYGW